MTSLPNQLELQSLFSGFLFETGLSAVSVKNYLSDLRHFFSFCASITTHKEPPTAQEIFQNLPKYLSLYLTEQKNSFTPQNTINRRSASIRRFSTFMSSKFGLSSNIQESLPSHEDSSLPTISKILDHFKLFLVKEKKTHSTVKNYISDLNHFFAWSANSTPFLDQKIENILSESQLNAYVTYLKLSHTSTSVINRRQSSIKQFTRYCFLQKYLPDNPFEYKRETPRLLPLSWFERLTSKKKVNKNGSRSRLAVLYQKYNALPFTPYLHLAILALATSAMVIFGYNQIIKQAKPSSAALPTVPRRQLSFQGRLTDSSGNPITTSVDVTFRLWNDLTAGSELYNSDACSIVPDPNGIFNTLIGGGSCGSEITNTVFTENRDIYLEVTVGSETLTPRQQIATVGYALNSETLQGYPASGAATINTVPIVNNDGDIIIAVDSPTINSTSGTFTLNGQALTLTTTANSGGDIVLQPDAIGSGQIIALGGTTDTDFFRIENANLTSGSLISGYVGNDTAIGRLLSLTSGSTETDRFYVAANGQTAINTAATLANAGLIIDQNGTGDLFTASAAGVTKFTINNNGNLIATGNLTGLTGLTVASGTVSLPNGEINNAEISELDWDKLQNYPSACPAGQAISQIGDTLTCVDVGGTTLWQRTLGSLSPLYITDSLNLGSTATSSALVHLAGTTGDNSWINNGNFGIGTTNPQASLDIQNTSNTLLNARRINESFDSVWSYVGTTWTDLTTSVSTSGSTTGDVLNVFSDYVYIGKSTPFTDIFFDFGTILSAGTTRTWEYSTGPGTWATLTITSDGTVEWSQDGVVNFASPVDWATSTVNGVTDNYWIRVSTTTGQTFSTEPTIRLCIPSATIPSSVAEIYSLNNDTLPSLVIDRNGGLAIGYADASTYRLRVAGSIYGTSLSTGAISGSTGAFSGAVTNTLSATGGLFSGGFITVAPAATALIRANNSPVIRLGSSAWNGSTAQINNMDILVRPYTFGTTTSSRMVFKNTTLAGVANSSELMTLDSSGNLSTLGTTYGSETVQDSTMDTAPPTNWTISGDWAYTTNDFTFTRSSGTGSITQASSRFLTPAVANRWYRLRYVVGVLGPAGTEMWVGSEFADRITRMHVLTTGTYDIFFKSNSSPGDLVLYASANTTSGLRIDSVSLMEVQSGDIMASGLFTGGGTSGLKIDGAGNVGIGITNPTYDLDVTGDINLTGALYDNGSAGTPGQILSTTGTGIQWIDAPTSGGAQYWQWNGGVLSPTDLNDSVTLGATSTASATVHLAGKADEDSFINTGNFGIGTTSPLSLLTVAGNKNATLTLENTDNDVVANDLVGSIDFYSRDTSSNLSGIVSQIKTVAVTDFSSGASPAGANSAITFHPNTGNAGTLIEAMRIDYNGNIGIGTTTPGYKLDVVGDINLTGALYDNGSAGAPNQILSSTGTGVEWIDASTISGAQYWQWNGGVLSPTDLNDSVTLGATSTASATVHLAGKADEDSFINTGNFGVGLTDPTSKLQVNGTFTSSGGDINLNSSSNYATNINTGTSTGAVTIGGGSNTVAINSTNWDISSSGAASGLTGITSSGTINFSELTASRAIFTDASKNLVSTATSQYLIDSISDETGTGSLVFGTAPTFTTNITTPVVLGGTTDSSSLKLQSTSGVGTTDYISLNVGNNGAVEALRAISNGYIGIGTTTPSQLLQVGTGTGFLVNSTGAIMNANGATISGSVRFSSMGAGILHADANGYLSSSAVNLATDVTGVLALANGGTNNDNSVSPYVSGKFLAYDGTRLSSTIYDENSFELALTFQNGLTRAVNTVEFGGANPLLHDTNVDQSTYNMTFTGAGNFGIGAAVPSQKLDVAGFFVVDTTNSRVGIGTTTPTAKLEIAGSTSTISNTSGDITFNAASNEFDFSGDSLKNFLNATVSGQIKLGNFVDAGRPATLGAGSLIYSTTQGGVQFSNGTTWQTLNNYFDRNTAGFLYPNKEWFDSINLFAATGDGATSSAKVRLSGDVANNTFFINPIAIGFNTAIDQPRAGYTYALQTSGGLLPKTDAVDRLGYSSYNWKELYLSNDIIKGSTAVITLGNYSLTGAVWHADQGFRVGDALALSPGLKFEVMGNASISGTLNVGSQLTVGGGVGKIDAGTVDPPYTIGGNKYATYMASMVGIKEEMVGKVTTTEDNYISGLGYRTLIDLDQQPIGSDIWLFSNITDIQSHINDLSVLLTPEGQAKAWYEVDVANKILAIYSSTPTNITYRLTAPRFDSAQWTNTRTSGSVGHVIPDSNNIYANNNSIFDNPVTSPELIAKLDGSGTYSLKINGVENKEVSSFMSSIIANLNAGLAVVTDLVADNLTVRTKLISPLADIDQLNAKNATISGTLYANDIKGQTVDRLHDQINLLNEKYSTSSAILADLQARYSSYDSLLSATSSAITTTDPLVLSPLATTSATFPSDLALNSLNVQTLIGNDILANGSIFTNSLSAFDTDLFIQPLGNQPVHLLANLMTLYPDGKVIVNGDLLITGTIFAQGLDTNTATVSGTLAVGSSTIATQSANFDQLTTSGLVIASGNSTTASTSSAQTNSNATIGVATIAAGTTEISILNTKVTPTTLIYITPTSDTAGRVLFVKSKTENVGFTVGITGDELTPEISFNYWLVETR